MRLRKKRKKTSGVDRKTASIRTMRTKLIAVTDEQKEQLLVACDFPMSYLPVALYLWDGDRSSRYNKKLSDAFNRPMKFKAVSEMYYTKQFSVLERFTAEERQIKVFNECVEDVKKAFLQTFDDLRRSKRVTVYIPKSRSNRSKKAYKRSNVGNFRSQMARLS